MEEIFARLLYDTLKDNPSAKETLIRLLKFYSENKELVRAVFAQSAPSASNATPAAPPPAEKKDCPSQQTGNPDIMQAYLNKLV